ncbi:ATP-dependent dethiobiotin synthetase BioD [Candidatus Erwinia haradaeae]|uniref:ATP-dependent dethiobiotin synthetase BioD n=1 Tax=Candidatus Erwinia haradaeae TaxID=1922217 RepID=A0A451DLI2_9GAMM|nr:dethiobiotin synthase [Candidatus Erwinia haradaeae]VFP87580.1 ATP-dependent dethiobiotin synthetase BioD [Candidatus Erwinia haradaeae]
MTKYFFITGTDTNIGKTIATCALLQAAIRADYRAVGYKPVASGCALTPDGPRNRDALVLMRSSNVDVSYNQVNPYPLRAPTAPHIASHDEGKSIDSNILSAGLLALGSIANWVVVEGTGGWLTPLGLQYNYSDWVIMERLPVILVVGVKLGCINHALLTASAVRQAGLNLIGWIANYPTTNSYRAQDYVMALEQRLDTHLLGVIPWIQNAIDAPLSNYLNLSVLEKPYGVSESCCL